MRYLHSLPANRVKGIESGCYLSHDGSWVLLYDIEELSLEEIIHKCSPALSVLWIWDDRNIEELDLSRFPNMTVLDLAGCKSLRQVYGIALLTQLKRLNLGRTRIAQLPDLSKLTKLQELMLFQRPMEQVQGLEKLTGLRYLNLNNTHITQLPGCIRGMRQLKCLSLC